VGELEEAEMNQEDTIADPFTPFEDLPEERKVIVTIRAVLVGCICGALVNASNGMVPFPSLERSIVKTMS
jgi:hypothetical protein